VRHINSRIRAGIIFSAMITAIVIAGCAKPKGSVSGKVVYKGVPLKVGKITYVSQEDSMQVFGALIGEDGTFTVENVPYGSYKVCIDTTANPSVGPPSSSAGGSSKGGGFSKPAGVKDKEVKSKPLDPDKASENFKSSNPDMMKAAKSNANASIEIPSKYRTKENTDITFTVDAPAKTHEIELK
jgi:hypothetical protein